MRNPYSLDHLWPPEVLEAWKSMPTDHQGKNLGFTESNREAWRQWCSKTPKHLWNPVMIQAYKELDRLKEKR